MKHIDLILVGVMALFCSIIFMLTRGIGITESENEWLVKKMATAISCEKNGWDKAGSSGDKNNGGGCAHQFGASCLLAVNVDKRNKTHTC